MSRSTLPRLSFRLQMTLVFGTLIAVMAVLLSFAVGELLKSRIREQAEISLSGIGTNVARAMANALYAGSLDVQKMADLHAVWAKGLASEDVRQMLATSQANSPSNSWIGVADLQGIVRAATGDILVGQNVSQRPWVAPGLKGNYVGDVHPAKLLATFLPPSATGEPLRFVDFATPVKIDGKVAGVLGIHGSWDWTHRAIETLLPAEIAARQVQVFIFDKAGEPIYAPGGKVAPFVKAGQKNPLPAGIGAAYARPAVSSVDWVDGRSYLTSVTPVVPQNPPSDLGWQVVVREPVDVAFAAVRTATWQTLTYGLIAALLGSLVAWVVSGRVSRPLSAMAKAAHQVQSGKLGAQIPVMGDSFEVQSLSTSLNSMTNKLVAANQEMEATVRLRTSELEAANEELGRLAHTDPLTGLLNRRGFNQLFLPALQVARRTSRPLTVAMVDIDHFKRINDRLGHDMGDRVLANVAELLRKRVRASDVVARLGGEEFVLMLPETSLEGAHTIAQELVDAVAAHWEGSSFGTVTISMGLASSTDGTLDGAALLQRADVALYQAKNEGRNRVCAAADAAAPPLPA
ncbi:MAG: diguanylate cyclase [Pseudomonadota bacterium]